MLKTALHLVKEGFHVFPLNGKIPFKGTHGFKDSTQDVNVITKWFTETFPKANVGIETGKDRGIFVLDIDIGKGGDESLCNLVKTNGDLPSTFTVVTGTGGYHYYFKYPQNVKIKSTQSIIGQGLDIKADGGYVVSPNSIHPDTGICYEKELSSPYTISDAPEWLLRLVSERKDLMVKDDYEVPQEMPKGIRNAELHRLASSLQGKGLHPKAIFAALQIERDERCEDPQSISDKELKNIVDSAMNLEVFSDYTQGIDITKVGIDYPIGSDAYNAALVNSQLNHNIAYCTQTKEFLLWNGAYWEIDSRHKIHNDVVHLANRLYQEGTELRNKEICKAAKKMMNDSSLKQTLSLLAKLVSKDMNDFDSDDFLFNVVNGTYDLRKMQFSEHNKRNYITKTSNVFYDPEAKCPEWEQFLDLIFNGDKELILFMQKAIGYSLTGDVGQQAFFICYGTGANGKSTFLETVYRLMGDYAKKTPASTLMENHHGAIPHDVARLNKSRFVIASESSRNKSIDEAKIKELTGENTIAVRNLYQAFFDMKITFKVFLQTNYKPTIKGMDYGIWRRTKLTPFTHKFSDDDKIEKFAEKKLYPEMSGILNWAIEGYRLLMEEGWNEPETVLNATKEYKNSEDIINQWIEEYCVIDKNSSEKITDLFNHYLETGTQKMGRKTFQEYLLLAGYEVKIVNNFAFYANGLRIKTKHEQGKDEFIGTPY